MNITELLRSTVCSCDRYSFQGILFFLSVHFMAFLKIREDSLRHISLTIPRECHLQVEKHQPALVEVGRRRLVVSMSLEILFSIAKVIPHPSCSRSVLAIGTCLPLDYISTVRWIAGDTDARKGLQNHCSETSDGQRKNSSFPFLVITYQHPWRTLLHRSRWRCSGGETCLFSSCILRPFWGHAHLQPEIPKTASKDTKTWLPPIR
jgi:hypothetical protein